MGLGEIAAGLEVTDEQRDRGVAVVDTAGASLAERLAPYDAALPCTPETAATVFESYTGGAAVETAAADGGVVPITAAKTLHLLGVDGLSPLGPQGRLLVRDWLAAELSRSKARELTGASETAFQLAVFIETHDPPAGITDAVEPALKTGETSLAAGRDALSDTLTQPDDIFTR